MYKPTWLRALPCCLPAGGAGNDHTAYANEARSPCDYHSIFQGRCLTLVVDASPRKKKEHVSRTWARKDAELQRDLPMSLGMPFDRTRASRTTPT